MSREMGIVSARACDRLAAPLRYPAQGRFGRCDVTAARDCATRLHARLLPIGNLSVR